MPGPASFFRATREGLEIFIRLTPKSSAEAVEGVAEGHDGRLYLKVRVRAVPEDGKANRALEKLLAKRLRVPRSDVSVVSGTTSRLKTVLVSGKAEDLVAKLNDVVSGGRRGGPDEGG